MGKRKALILFFATILTLMFCTPILGSAVVNGKYRSLSAQYNIGTKGEIKIPFEYKLNKKTINNSNVFVIDGNNKKIKVKATLDRSSKIINIKPTASYIEGKSYTIFISSNIRFVNGKHPLLGVKMKFTVVNEKGLPVVGTIENLRSLLEMATQYNNSNLTMIRAFDGKASATTSNAAKSSISNTDVQGNTNGINNDFSETNVQVNGVDEADIVKTDGEYIYQVNNQSIIIAKAIPADKMEITSRITFDDDSFNPSEIYVDNKYLVVIGMDSNKIYYKDSSVEMQPTYPVETTKALVYDISDKNNVKKIREVDLEGNYVSSRKVGTKLYLITNKFIYFNANPKMKITPSYMDSVMGKNYINIKCEDIHYFPSSIESNYMIIGTIDINDNYKRINVSTYLGSGQNVYMSTNNLYVAVSKYDDKNIVKPQVSLAPSVKVRPGIWWPGNVNRNTFIYKFTLKGVTGEVSFLQKGEVPGEILNQFSMDENGDSFRIATTKGNAWGSGENTSKNNLYILDSNMKITGKIEGMAPGEKIYSVRFMGNRAYVVTFKTVDPLFVIDLKDNKNPRILGALKIPGFSDYLHPYDENHVIGFGKDTIELPYKDSNGKTVGTNAYYLGMKIAIFDVTDVTDPKESGKDIIGDRGTYSQLLNDHKALLFSKEKNLLAFPVTVFKLKPGQNPINDQNGYSYPEYGTFEFQGAYVYKIDINKGFTLRGKITHLSSDDYMKSGINGDDGTKDIDRILYINDTLYTTSDKIIKATNINDMQDKGVININ